MKSVSVLEFRRNLKRIIRKVQRGQRLILTLRDKPVLRLEPILEPEISSADPFYSLDKLAVPGGRSVSNQVIDNIVYLRSR